MSATRPARGPATGPSSFVAARPGEPLGDDLAPVVVMDPAAWSDDDIAGLRDRACRGGVVIATVDGGSAAWMDLVGVDVDGPRTAHGELVVEPGDHPAARNLDAEQVLIGSLTPLRRREGTAVVVEASIALTRRPVVTVRRLGEGLVIGWAIDATEGTVDGLMGTVLARLVNRVVESPTTTVGLGIVGYGQHGGMGWLHGTAATTVPGLSLAAIAELSPERLADAGRRFVGAGLHDSTEALLADDAVDVVVVATPPSTHHQITLQALRAGKHVVVEKPLCFTAAEADELLETAASVDRTLTVHQNRRWDADFRAIRALVDAGRLGEVFNVETFVGGFEHPCRLWHSDVGVSGGRLYDWGAHLIDQTLRLVGHSLPATVQAVGHKRVWHDVTNQDQIRVRMTFDDGREAEFLDSDVLAVRRPKYVVQGTRGTLVGRYSPVVTEDVTADDGYVRTEHHHAEGPARLSLAEHHPGWGLHEIAVPNLPCAPHPFHRALVDHLQLGDAVPVDPVEIRDVTSVLEAATTSARGDGSPVTPA